MNTAQPKGSGPGFMGLPPARLISYIYFHPELLGLAAAVLWIVGLYLALIWAPVDLLQGEPYRIFYLHLPMALAAYLSFIVVFIGGILYLWKRKRLFDVWARSAAEVGLLFLTLVIVSGGIWGQATWGTFWAWEPRLTFTFILWLIFVAYVMLRQTVKDQEQGARYAAVLGIIGFLDMPMVFLSVYMTDRDLHPEPRELPPEVWTVTWVTFAAFMALLAYILIQRVRIEQSREELEELRASLEE